MSRISRLGDGQVTPLEVVRFFHAEHEVQGDGVGVVGERQTSARPASASIFLAALVTS